MTIKIIILVILICMSGFFSGSEVALLSVTAIKVRTFIKQKKRGSLALQRLKAKPRRMIITILIGNNVVNISAAALASILSAEIFGSTGVGITLGVLTLLILIFGEITPKTFSAKHSITVALLIAPTILALTYILYPFVIFLDWLTNLFESRFKMRKHDSITEADIKSMIEFGVEKEIVAPAEQYIINKALTFSDITARDVMIPLDAVFSLLADKTCVESINEIIERGYSRVPIFENDKKNITGIVMVKNVAREIINQRGATKLKQIAAPPILVPQDIRIDYLFKIFQKKHVHIAIAEDNMKKAVGIATLEDLLEELVGEIQDESDRIIS
ncbi:hemolysin family protein [Patescibacteria group bacterium]|nr:hemolysin family protein [Patescibacteria group bacterium]MBU0964170.1 hemolysin family protein [Patescibacteria group bacterium]